MKNLILVILILLASIGCSVSSLNFHKGEELVFKYNSKEFLLSNKVDEHKFLNYKDLFVNQYKLEDTKGRVLFYEKVETALDFEFKSSALYTVMYIFNDTKEYEEVYHKNNLRLVQLKLKDKRGVNVLIQASDTQVISYVYGFSNYEFIKLAKQLGADSDVEIKELKYQGVLFNTAESSVTNWNDKMVYLTPLITPIRVMGNN